MTSAAIADTGADTGADTRRAKRRPRDPEATREAILEAARTLIARSGTDAVSLSEVAHLAGVNRGTAYQHFETREKLLTATVEWVSDRMFREVFGDPATIGVRAVDQVDPADLTERLARFAMANPELGRVWLLQVLSAPDPAADPFLREYVESLGRFARSGRAQPGIDVEVLAVMNLSAMFLWPVWARAHAIDQAGRTDLARRLADECLRMSLHGSMRAEFFPALADRLAPGGGRSGN